MTIEQLLAIAFQNIDFARSTSTIEQAERAVCASIAQAAATTAQAMILYAASHESVGASRVIDIGVFQQG